MKAVKAIPIGFRGDGPRVALKLDYPLLKFSSGYQEQINTQRCYWWLFAASGKRLKWWCKQGGLLEPSKDV